jgi:hypothetical protein
MNGEICQFDLWRPRAQLAVGHGQTARVGRHRVPWALARGRRRADLSIKPAEVLVGIHRCLWSLGGAAA